jgi:hypothetical protein
MYRITEPGFSLLAMGFSGAKWLEGLSWPDPWEPMRRYAGRTRRSDTGVFDCLIFFDISLIAFQSCRGGDPEARPVPHDMHRRHLAQADRHIASSLTLIERQRELIATLERNGRDSLAARARQLLALFEETLRLMQAHREMILRALSDRGIAN